MSKFKPGTVEENSSSTIGPPAGIEPTPSPCRSNALTIELRRYLTRASLVYVYIMVVMPANRLRLNQLKFCCTLLDVE